MRVILIIVILMFILNVDVVDSRGINIRRYVRNLRKSIENKCNNAALYYTNNTQMYNCFKMNKSNYCNHLDNYTDYNKNMEICILDNNASLGSGVFISVILMLIISLCSMA